MGRIVQQVATVGSQRWLQELVRSDRNTLESQMGLGSLIWLSPLETDDYAEYQDSAFLELLGAELSERPLDSFWPADGPAWDGLARTPFGASVLVDAMAHPTQMASSCTIESPEAIAKVRSAFDETKAAFDVEPEVDWCEGHYEYASRLAHAYLMNELNGVPTELVFLYFIGATDVDGPSSRDEWVASVLATHAALGVLGQLPRYVHDVFVDVSGRAGRASA